MWLIFKVAAAAILLGLAGCSTPFRPPVHVYGSAPFKGLDSIIRNSGGEPVDVILVHGMCTKPPSWAHATVDTIMGAIKPGYKPLPRDAEPSPAPGSIHIIHRKEDVDGVPIHFSALMWSPLTAELKQQLDFDRTGSSSTDCAANGACQPRRARLNGMLKDGLLNDCLADALIYQGGSKAAIREKMMAALGETFNKQGPGALILLTESLGSKITFDALVEMLERKELASQFQIAQLATSRLVQVFMAGNQLAILGLADQDAGAAAKGVMPQSADSLQRFLALRLSLPRPRDRRFSELTLVAFTDPNDLLSYRLLPTKYASATVLVADVLVSNQRTFLGLLENPFTAHTSYLENPDVARIVACGGATQSNCR